MIDEVNTNYFYPIYSMPCNSTTSEIFKAIKIISKYHMHNRTYVKKLFCVFFAFFTIGIFVFSDVCLISFSSVTQSRLEIVLSTLLGDRVIKSKKKYQKL